MKKLLFFIIILFGILNVQLAANYDSGTNSYDYGCGVGIPPSVCGADGSSRTNSPSGNSKSKISCSKALKSIEDIFRQDYKKNNPNKKVTYKFVEKVPNSKIYAFKFIISDKNESEEIRFAFDGDTGSIYRRFMSVPDSKFELMGQQDILICN